MGENPYPQSKDPQEIRATINQAQALCRRQKVQSTSRKSLAVLPGLVLSFSFGFARAQAQSIPEGIVDALNKVWGVHPGFRANHAKVLSVMAHSWRRLMPQS